ncbi:MAG: DegT/DnrJ/EryC1/StrS aminotransferase family protein, partial [Methylobacteriaceae bacterium]|nr:DegT/DnrJ/EryC1/StrS aminotransferase family protein [Methylobacteriaceae bacterium]
MMAKIEFIDLQAQRRRLGASLDAAIREAIEGGQYILGPQVAEFETKLAAFSGAKHCIGVANGTDAIGICLMTMGLRPGDAVICPAFTFAATAEAVAWLGATPVFVDVEERSYNIDPDAIEAGFEAAERAGLRPRAVIAVDLFGQPADYARIESVCARRGVKLICDSAQGFGATYKGRRTGSIGDFTTASFFPAKPLGCYGDGGAILTQDDAAAEHIRSLRFHGKGADKYDNVRIGMNSRLDTLQAAILLQKLSIFEDEIAARQKVAQRYHDGLRDVCIVPEVADDCVSVWAQYTIRVAAERRDAFMQAMKARGVPTNVYYPRPLHRQTAYARFPVAGNGLPVSERVAQEVVSLPMHPYLDEATQALVIDA